MMNDLSMIDCRFCDWTIAGDGRVFDLAISSNSQQTMKDTSISMMAHQVEKHPIKKYIGLRSLTWEQKKCVMGLWKEYKRGVRFY